MLYIKVIWCMSNNNFWFVCVLCCLQVQSFVRGRSVRKRRDKLKAEGRAQSLPRDEMLPCKVGINGLRSSVEYNRCTLLNPNMMSTLLQH